MKPVDLARRTFLLGSTAIAGGLAVGYYVTKPLRNPLLGQVEPGEVAFAPYVKINTGNDVTVVVPRSEMGQGIHTTLAALVAEELDVSMEQISVEHGPADNFYYNSAVLEELVPYVDFEEGMLAGVARSMETQAGKLLGLQITAGSTSVKDGFEKMRLAGALVRSLLVQAAAGKWNADGRTFITENGSVSDPFSGNSATYGELCEAAASLEVPEDLSLKSNSQWKILGKPLPRLDFREKVTGSTVYGPDIQLAEMLYGTVRLAPGHGLVPVQMNDLNALDVPGFIKTVSINLPHGNGFGVITTGLWEAFKAAEALEIQWSEPSNPIGTEEINLKLENKLKEPADFALREEGNADLAFADAPRNETIEAKYSVPLLAHGCMEPLSATVRLGDGFVEVWTASQAPTMLRSLIAENTGLEDENIHIHTIMSGGSFGRRLESDFVLFAVEMAKQTGGLPINVVWSRQEDFTHDYYRPPAVANMRARIKRRKLPLAVEMSVSSPSVLSDFMKRTYPDWYWAGADKMITAGAHDQPYSIENFSVAAHQCDLKVPIGFWRSNGASFNSFFLECFLDEVAHAGRIDALGMRLQLLAEHPPAIKVLQKVSEMSGWGRDLPENKGLGLAQSFSFGTWVAVVIEVTSADDLITMERVWCAVDIGQALDPQIVKAQISSGIIFGLSSAIDQEITFSNGEVQQKDFPQFGMLRMDQCPDIDIELVKSGGPMGGAGEAGTPPSIPALVNAIYDATGKRIRNLPLSRHFRFS
ncbi:MAG: molybdopterin cofactor-binding domain-containing protein [Rhizobiaceae bacterium]